MTEQTNINAANIAIDLARDFYKRKNEFWAWHAANPKFWEYFERIAMEAAGRGMEGLSQVMVANVARWQIHVKEGGEDLFPSNEHTSFFSRYWNHKHPEHSKLFKHVALKGERELKEAESKGVKV